jgi:hypothetical protein
MKIAQEVTLIRTRYVFSESDLVQMASDKVAAHRKRPYINGGDYEWDEDKDGRRTLTITVDAEQPRTGASETEGT